MTLQKAFIEHVEQFYDDEESVETYDSGSLENLNTALMEAAQAQENVEMDPPTNRQKRKRYVFLFQTEHKEC